MERLFLNRIGVRMSAVMVAEMTVTIAFPYCLGSNPLKILMATMLSVMADRVPQYFTLVFCFVVCFVGSLSMTQAIAKPPMRVEACCSILNMGMGLSTISIEFCRNGIACTK